MISNREMFCSVIGVVISTVPKEYATDILFQSAKEFGIEKDEAKIIISELKDTLGFACAKMLKKMQGKNHEEFGI